MAYSVPAPPTIDGLTILQPDDYHHHLRDEPFLEHTVPHAARAFGRLLVMPNLVPPVTTTEAALEYRERILKRVPSDVPEGEFTPLMTLYLTDNTSPEEIRKAKASGHIYAVKLYPAGATTNSDFGVTDYEKILPALEAMQEEGILLLVHGESTDQSIDIFEREQSFYAKTMPELLAKVPRLKVVCEHVTSAVGASFVEAQGPNVSGTITAHHLAYNRNALFKGGIQPHFYCLPILKAEPDRQKLIECATSTSGKFFLGTDSAPHSQDRKECACGCAGCFTAHMSVELVAEVFSDAGKLDVLEDFVSKRGAAFYGLEPAQKHRILSRETWKVPDSYSFGPTVVRPLRAGEEMKFKLRPRSHTDSSKPGLRREVPGIVNGMPTMTMDGSAPAPRDYVILEKLTFSKVPTSLQVCLQTVDVKNESSGPAAPRYMARGINLGSAAASTDATLNFVDGSFEHLLVNIERVC